MSVSAVCPGSFDPVTNGHLDVIERAASRFDELVIACLRNPAKEPLFHIEDRLELLEQCTRDLGNVDVVSFEGLLVDLCDRRGVGILVKGLRAVSDFESELQMAQMNVHLGGVDTFFLPASPVHSFLSSSLVKQVAELGGDVSDLVPPAVAERLRERLR